MLNLGKKSSIFLISVRKECELMDVNNKKKKGKKVERKKRRKGIIKRERK